MGDTVFYQTKTHTWSRVDKTWYKARITGFTPKKVRIYIEDMAHIPSRDKTVDASSLEPRTVTASGRSYNPERISAKRLEQIQAAEVSA